MYHAAPPLSSATARAGRRLQTGRGIHSGEISRNIPDVIAPADI